MPLWIIIIILFCILTHFSLKHGPDEDIAERWLMAYPSKQHDLRKQTILNNPNTLKKYRKRLGDLSWFMRRLNEPLAKLSNREEGCNGRFWQGRYHSQALFG